MMIVEQRRRATSTSDGVRELIDDRARKRRWSSCEDSRAMRGCGSETKSLVDLARTGRQERVDAVRFATGREVRCPCGRGHVRSRDWNQKESEGLGKMTCSSSMRSGLDVKERRRRRSSANFERVEKPKLVQQKRSSAILQKNCTTVMVNRVATEAPSTLTKPVDSHDSPILLTLRLTQTVSSSWQARS
jgi:hypothetical protein